MTEILAALARPLAFAGLLATPALAQTVSPPADNPAAQRGRAVAERRCATCHAIGGIDSSPSAMAPPFRALRMRYNPISLERHIADLTAKGYFGMPPQPISQDEARDVAAFIETLREP